MKIKNKEDVKDLDRKIKDELGIDISKYKNEKVISNFVELFLLPQYIVSWVIRPVLFSLFLYFFGFYSLKLVHIEYIIYAVVGLVLFFLTGILSGIILLLFKMKMDILKISNYSLEIMKLAIKDLSNTKSQITSENRGYVFSLLFKGILHIVTIPILTHAVTDKIPLIGGFFGKIIRKVLIFISDKIDFKEVEVSHISEEEGTDTIDSYIENINFGSESLEKLVSFSFKVVKLPVFLLFTACLLILIFFIYIIN
ncbi:hypothetical protein [Tenacibaculum sp. M341]|uniref:hypothetical protein n=1 Tax=Tenacibaculum sp. M341 TaxID=2530339 RepID=UPI0010434D54|nr:hypothetical protein [Tenacibaculum sp. M341]TCI94925.1 hypothetical protein EYW44_00980 [Tenacibaculum sp. M341]